VAKRARPKQHSQRRSDEATSGPIEDDDWDDPARLALVVIELRVRLRMQREEPIPFLTRRNSSSRSESLRPDLDDDARMGDKVVVPGRVSLPAAYRREDDVARAVQTVDERRKQLAPRFRARCVKQENRPIRWRNTDDAAVGAELVYDEAVLVVHGRGGWGSPGSLAQDRPGTRRIDAQRYRAAGLVGSRPEAQDFEPDLAVRDGDGELLV